MVTVTAAFAHHGLARLLVHRLKYQADLSAGRALAGAMAARADPAWRVLVPVPRAVVRRLRYGIDPARWLAQEVADRTGLVAAEALRPGLWWPRHAGASGRAPPPLRLVTRLPEGVVLVDDVVTTGATLAAAARLVGARHALVATRRDQ